jgi:hypothetical protein
VPGLHRQAGRSPLRQDEVPGAGAGHPERTPVLIPNDRARQDVTNVQQLTNLRQELRALLVSPMPPVVRDKRERLRRTAAAADQLAALIRRLEAKPIL